MSSSKALILLLILNMEQRLMCK